jgi:hypothetical protein
VFQSLFLLRVAIIPKQLATDMKEAFNVKVNMKSLCLLLTEHHAMKGYWGVEV